MKRARLAALAVALAWAGSCPAAPALRVCADPSNLPFSDSAGEGFENKIAALIAARLDRPLQFVWRAQRRGFLREGINKGACDLVTAIPLGLDAVADTRPYYRSTYVFVTRPDEPAIGSVDDKSLARRLIGVQLVGDDQINSPPAHLLAWRGYVQNVRGFSVYGDESDPNSGRRIVDAVAKRDIDAAAVWGPVAGYYAARETPALTVTPIAQPSDSPAPMAFDIAMGVRKTDRDLLHEVNAALDALSPQIERILADYDVPTLSP